MIKAVLEWRMHKKIPLFQLLFQHLIRQPYSMTWKELTDVVTSNKTSKTSFNFSISVPGKVQWRCSAKFLS
jgi:hypothetical protein